MNPVGNQYIRDEFDDVEDFNVEKNIKTLMKHNTSLVNR